MSFNWMVRFAAPVADPVRMLSLVEQALISGGNFALLLGLARGFPAQSFGQFSFAYIILQFLVNLHRSLVVVPFVIHTAGADGLGREGRLWQWLNVAVILASMLGLELMALAAALMGAPDWMREAFQLATLLVAPTFTYEFFRRWAIQLGDYRLVVRAAALYAAVVAGGVVAALLTGSLAVAIAAYLAGNLVAAGLFVPIIKRTLPARSDLRLWPFLHSLRGFLSWSLLATLAYNGYAHLPALILGALAGPVPVAAFQALRNFTQPINILGTAVDNFDKPRAARALAAEGIIGMRRQLLRTTIALAMAATPYLLLLVVFAKPALAAVYADRYAGFEVVLYCWVAVHALSITAYPFETGLMLLRRPDLLFRGRLLSAAVGIATCLIAVPFLGAEGAMLGLLGGALVNVLCGARYLSVSIRCEVRS